MNNPNMPTVVPNTTIISPTMPSGVTPISSNKDILSTANAMASKYWWVIVIVLIMIIIFIYIRKCKDDE